MVSGRSTRIQEGKEGERGALGTPHDYSDAHTSFSSVDLPPRHIPATSIYLPQPPKLPWDILLAHMPPPRPTAGS